MTCPPFKSSALRRHLKLPIALVVSCPQNRLRGKHSSRRLQDYIQDARTARGTTGQAHT